MSTLPRSPHLRTSRVPGFYRLSVTQRRERLEQLGWLRHGQVAALETPATGFDDVQADAMVENVIGVHGLPLGVALHFRINGVERIIPMSVEEPSIIAACSYAARMVEAGGGFFVEADAPELTAQIQLLDVREVERAVRAIEQQREALIDEANAVIPAMVARGGGVRGLEVRILAADCVVVHVHVDCRDAMGANTVNLVAEALAPTLAVLTGARIGLRILTNLADRRRVRVRCRVPVAALGSEDFPDGATVRERIVEAQRFAELDPYRAVTHNKGVMNGVDSVLVAFGNDWRAVEAGAHAWASRLGTYRPLTTWKAAVDGALEGTLELPMATSSVGGAARTHPGVKLALDLAGISDAQDLGALAGSAGLASNLAALRALATEGITRGHMGLHARRVAAEAGAQGEDIARVAEQLSRERCFRPERARELLAACQAVQS